MEHIHHDNREIDLITLPEELRRMKKLDAAGGLEYVMSLPNLVATAANIEYHSNIVKDKAMTRNLITTCNDLTTEAYDGGKMLKNSLMMQNGKYFILLKPTQWWFSPVSAIVDKALDKITKLHENKESLTGLSTGFRDLDSLTSGLQPSDLILIAARPSMGKTAFTLNIAQNVGVKLGKSVAFFSLEMSKEQLVQRLMCQLAHINSQKLRTGQIESDEEWDKLFQSCEALYQSPIYIDDTPGISVQEMRSKARRLKSEHGLDLIIVDYLQLMQGRNSESRQQEISEISRSLKALARELNVPLIALSQLSRSVESRQDKRPMLSDLRESGALEQDADIVSFLYRDDYYNKESEIPHITELIVAKHRNGATATIKLYFRSEFTLFANLDTSDDA